MKMKSFTGYIKEFTHNSDENWPVANFYILKTMKTIKISGNISRMIDKSLYKIEISEINDNSESVNNININPPQLLTVIDNQTFFEYLKSDAFNKVADDDFINILKSYYESDDILKEILANKEKFLAIKRVQKCILESIFNKLNITALQIEFNVNGLDLDVLVKLTELYNGSFDQIIKAIKNDLFEINFQHEITNLESIDKIFLHFNNDANNVVRIAYYLHYYCKQNSKW
nr:hypothetical protein [Mycoplasmopsis bovis]